MCHKSYCHLDSEVAAPTPVDVVLPDAFAEHAGYRYRICARSHLTADGSAHHTGSLGRPSHDFVLALSFLQLVRHFQRVGILGARGVRCAREVHQTKMDYVS